jgi:hypothetical protein
VALSTDAQTRFGFRGNLFDGFLKFTVEFRTDSGRGLRDPFRLGRLLKKL